MKFKSAMWDEPMPTWRKAQKKHQCQGDGCTKVIARGERYLDRALRHPPHSHFRYCRECAEPVVARAIEYHMASNGDGVARINARNDFPDRYQKRISSALWKVLKRKVIELRGSRCERCEQVSASLALHHLHYHSLGNEQPEDVELLCAECHTGVHEASRPKYDPPKNEGLIVGPDGVARWEKFDPDMVYIPLEDGRNVPVPSLNRKGKS